MTRRCTFTTICTSGQSRLVHLAAMPLPPRLEAELAELRRTSAIDVVEEGDWINVVFRAFRSAMASTFPLRICSCACSVPIQTLDLTCSGSRCLSCWQTIRFLSLRNRSRTMSVVPGGGFLGTVRSGTLQSTIFLVTSNSSVAAFEKRNEGHIHRRN